MNPLSVGGFAFLNFIAMLVVAQFVLKSLAIRFAHTPFGQALGVLVAS
jgi:hypothetical protein